MINPDCPFCPAVRETNEHCLLDCHRYALERLTLTLGLSFIPVDLDLSYILGGVEHLEPPSDRREILSLTASYLLDVDSIRHL